MSADAGSAGTPLPFEARRYLDEYFRTVDEEYEGLYRFWCRTLAELPLGLRALELGSGPALYSTLCLAARCDEVHLADFVPACFAEIDAWLRAEPGCFDWTPHAEMVLGIEGLPVTPAAVAAREATVRRIVTRMLPCDLRKLDPLGHPVAPYDLVTAHYCVEMATSTPQEWAAVAANICRLVRPGGTLLLSSALSLRLLRVFHADEVAHFAATVTPEVAEAAMREGGMDLAQTRVSVLAAPPQRPYAGTLLLAAKRAI